jgi:TolB-like protein/Tfp pilus assembly protein PilF
LTTFRFATFTLDPGRNRLQSDGRQIDLRPKSFDLLRQLVENPDRLIPRDELMRAVWPDVIVTDDSLKRCISEIRAALGDERQEMIRTIPRRGYLFTVPVARIDSAETVASIASEPADPDRPSIAVLPFFNMSGDPDQDYFSDGISEDLTTMLSKFAGLLVIARNSAFQFKGRHVDMKHIGRELGVRYLLEGSVRRDAQRVRITAQLIDAATARHLWAETYDRELADVFAVQDDVARRIVVSLIAHVNKSEIDRARRKTPEKLAAYDLYLRGNPMMKSLPRETRGETIVAARALFERSIAIDPDFAPAYHALADTYMAAWFAPAAFEPIGREFHRPETLQRAFALAHKAVELDGGMAEAHATLAWIMHWQYRRAESLSAFERAIARNPNFLEGSYRYGIALIHHGRTQEGIDFLHRVLRLDPFHPPFYESCLGTGYYMQGRYAEALELLRIATQRIQGYRMFGTWHAAAAAQMGHAREAAAALADLKQVEPDLTISKWLDFIRLAKPEDAQRTVEGLRKAGLPD